jgi:hypothetical protein
MSDNKDQSKPQPAPAPATAQPTAPAQPVAQVKTDQPQVKAVWPTIRYVTEAAEKDVAQTNLVRETARETPPPVKGNEKSGK